MRLNSRRIQKILGRVWTAPKCIFETLLHSRTTRCIGINATHVTFLFNLENQTMDFSYTIFTVKKINVGKILKIMRKLLFNYSFYSHPEIGKFQGVTRRYRMVDMCKGKRK
jgi:hypothetical protein